MTRHSAKFASTRIDSEPSDDWRKRSACRDSDPELHFPVGTSGPALLQVEQAKANCRRCPVTRDCLTFAMSGRVEDGIWGGMTEDERRTLARMGGVNTLWGTA